MTRFLIVPQWQGSPAARAMALADGAEAIAGDLPQRACTRVAVPLEAGDAQGTGVHRLSALQRTREALEEAMDASDERPLVIGGDCSTAVPAIARAARDVPGIGLVWFDAHPDLHDEDSSPSGAGAGMALRAVLGDGPLAIGSLERDRVVLVGARSIDDGEREATAGLSAVSVDELAEDEASVADAVAATGATAVWVHVDLDVLDPAEVTGVADAVPFGASPAAIVRALAALTARGIEISGASLCGFAPVSPAAAVDDLGTILRLVGALA